MNGQSVNGLWDQKDLWEQLIDLNGIEIILERLLKVIVLESVSIFYSSILLLEGLGCYATNLRSSSATQSLDVRGLGRLSTLSHCNKS